FEINRESLGPDLVAREVFAQAEHAARFRFQASVQAKEQLVGGTPRVEERREQVAAEQVEAGSAQEIALEGQLMRQGRQQSLAVAFQSPQKTAHTTAANLNAQVGSREVVQGMSFVEDKAAG